MLVGCRISNYDLAVHDIKKVGDSWIICHIIKYNLPHRQVCASFQKIIIINGIKSCLSQCYNIILYNSTRIRQLSWYNTKNEFSFIFTLIINMKN